MKTIKLVKYLGVLLATNLIIPTAHADTDLPGHSKLRRALQSVVGAEINGGAGLNLWAVITDSDGVVKTVAFSGKKRKSQRSIARSIATAKASTVSGLSLDNIAVSSSHIFGAAQPNNLFQSILNAHPLSDAAYHGPVKFFGTRRDPMIGKVIGGTTTLAGGLALYNESGELIGGLGIAGEVHPCADHNAAWIMRDALKLDNLTANIGPSITGDDNIIHDLDNEGNSTSGFGSPECAPQATAISEALPTNFPIGANY